MIDVVERLKTELTDQPVNPLRPAQIAAYHGELKELGVIEAGRDLDGRQAQDGPQGRDWLGAAKGGARRRAQQIRKILDEQAPHRVMGERASRVHALVKETLDTIIKPGLAPRSAMRRNPPGVVGHLLRTEFNGEFKDAILAVKRGLWALDPGNTDPDFTNIERFRPEGLNPDGTSTFMADAQIPGVFGMTVAAKANWPLGEPTADTALGQVRRREDAIPRREDVPRGRVPGALASEPERQSREQRRLQRLARPAQKIKEPRQKRVLTEAQKQELRDRLAAARQVQAERRAAPAATE